MRRPTVASQAISVAFIATTTVVITVLVHLSGTKGIAVHFYYIPIIYAGFAFGDYGAIIVSLLSASLCGPWMPAEVTAEGKLYQTEWDILLRAAIFYVIGIAASRTSLALKRRIYEAHTLYDVARSITSTLRIREVLRLIAQHAVGVMDARACAIRLLDQDTNELELAAYHGLSDEYAHKGPVSVAGSELDRQVLEGNVLQISDVSTDPRFQYPEEARREGIAAVLSVPLESRAETLGVIRIYSGRRRRFSISEVELLQAFARHAAVAIENAELYEDIRRSYYETVRALTIAIEARDSATYSHSERVTELAVRLARQLGLGEDEIELLRFGCILHDIGKIGVAEGFLDAREGPTETQVFYKMHPLIGRSILQPISFLHPILPVVVSHHENWDGTGFPEGLAGNDIPRLARIVAVADRYERWVNPEGEARVGLSEKEAVEKVVSEAGSQFDPEIVLTFNRMMSRAAAPVTAAAETPAPDGEPAPGDSDIGEGPD